MLKSPYEHEKDNKNIYDDIRKYCMAEQVNEVHFRASINKPGLGGKLVNKSIIIALLILCIIGSVVSCSQNASFETTENTTVKMIEGTHIYESGALDMSIEFPAEWKDKYEVCI